jgi:hypothetical protein
MKFAVFFNINAVQNDYQLKQICELCFLISVHTVERGTGNSKAARIERLVLKCLRHCCHLVEIDDME